VFIQTSTPRFGCKASSNNQDAKNIYLSLLQIGERGAYGNDKVSAMWGDKCPKCQDVYTPAELFYRIHYRKVTFVECFQCLRISYPAMTVDELRNN
jgi:hypothetical protein